MGGLELLKQLQQEIPRAAIVITAHQEEQLRDRTVAVGAVGFFRKPCDNRQLLAAV
jgi:DNA-binding NarL/FixJ family response regulator